MAVLAYWVASFQSGVGRGRIEAHGERLAAVHADGVPDEVARGGPGEVAHAVGGEAPGERRVGVGGREAGSPISSLPRMMTVASLVRARASRARCAAVSTSSGFCSVPVAATIMSAGTVRLTSKLPYSR